MSDDNKKPAFISKPDDGAIRVRTLMFGNGTGVDLPSEQRQAKIQTAIIRADKPRYDVWFVPRLGMYRVIEYAPAKASDKPETPKGTPVREFGIPREWAIAEWDPT